MEEIDYELDDCKENNKPQNTQFEFKQGQCIAEGFDINDSKFIQNAIAHISFMQNLYTKIQNQSKELKLLIQDTRFEYKEAGIYLKNNMDPTQETKFTMEYLINQYNNQAGLQEKVNQSFQMQIDSIKKDYTEIQEAYELSISKSEEIFQKVGKYR